jgi:hypothetical protein
VAKQSSWRHSFIIFIISPVLWVGGILLLVSAATKQAGSGVQIVYAAFGFATVLVALLIWAM